jgi:uncharacterized protein
VRPLSREEILAVQKRRTNRLLADDSPVPLEARKNGFAGLEYFPIDTKYQFILKMQTDEGPAQIQVALSNGEVVHALRAGVLEFELDGRRRRLHAYKKKADDLELFVPFKDGTSGRETYGAGRYIDIIVDQIDNSCVLDFNLSYSPLCMFDSSRYVCPYPPSENWLLDVNVQAGEKKFDRKPLH